MLCQYTVKNFKSIREEVTLDMQATSISEHEDRIFAEADGEKFLPVAAIYGPNGGGKSNLLASLYTLRAKIVRPILTMRSESQKFEVPGVTPFLFTKEERPTEFEIFFRTKVAEYKYYLALQKEKVVKEALSQRKFENRKISELFYRDENGVELKGDLAKLTATEISSTLPLLSYLGILYGENGIISDVINWFRSSLYVMNYGNYTLEQRLLKLTGSDDEDFKELRLKMLKEMDIDIEDFRIEKIDDGSRRRIYTTHTVDGLDTELEISEESSGTRKVFSIITFVIDSLLTGSTLVVDELDAKLHPCLLKYLIGLYTDLKVNKFGAQLIFTSHDLTTMNSDVFRRDEIWFVAKGNKQDSQMYSLVEFKMGDKKVRKDARFDKQYLEGKYGADPYLKKIIDWENVNV